MRCFERKLIVVSIVVGLRYVSVSRLVCLRVIIKSRKFIHIVFISGIELYVMYLVYVCIDDVWVSSCLCRI